MILPGVIVAGAPRLAADITLIEYDPGSAGGNSFTYSSLSWGAEVKRPNKRSVAVTVVMESSRNITGTPTINGANAAIIYNAATSVVNSLAYRFVCFTAEVPSGASGSVSFNTTGSPAVQVGIYRIMNLDVSNESDSDIGAGTGAASLVIDCPANGGIIGQGLYAYSSGSTPTSADFANLTTLEWFDSNVGGTVAAEMFATAQTGLSVTYDPTPNTNITRAHAFALAFARTY